MPRPKGNGPGTGPGWGGPAKGAGHVAPRHEFDGPGPGRGHFSLEGEGRLEREARHAAEMREIYYAFATDPEAKPETAMIAATHLLNRMEGLPVAKVVTASMDPLSRMTDEELAAELEGQRKRVRIFEESKGQLIEGE